MNPFRKLSVHYGWLVLIMMTLTILASMGLGRFSFGIMIPFIRSDMQLSYTSVGYLTTALFSGYLVGSLQAGSFIRRYQHRRTIICGLFVFSSVLFIFSHMSSLVWMFVLVFTLGVLIGILNISALGLLFNWFADGKKGMALGIANAGGGGGMVFSGMFVPYMVSYYQADSGWREATLLFFGFSATIWLFCILFLRNNPAELALDKIGANHGVHTEPHKQERDRENNESGFRSLLGNPVFMGLGISYFLWGFSYLIFTTFLVDYLMEGLDYSKTQAGGLFSLAGITSIASGFICGSLSDRFGRVRVLTWVYSIQSVLLLLLLLPHPITITGSVFLYALTLWGVPTLMMASAGDFLPPRAVPTGMGFLTLFFSIGQALSPLCTGWVVSATHSYTISFLISAACCAVGAVLLMGVARKQALAAKNEPLSTFVPEGYEEKAGV
ncbi:sugar phosphate permease [Aneurinibacillus soli]|uniref:Putative sulfoacetate transporter SauU n=1 Tax=Aneurinibacillus soli TaxID=1500254 RepID=A0A0U5BCZ4_9BACL|nr:MFS transporter [Aneurinibacillus soli]PYE62207.1 sugar phosphate permease [Aneurinibacillus soli]BAU28605.1 putative sulfoacetate transporter SauU [Aneurinibacillus soli]